MYVLRHSHINLKVCKSHVILLKMTWAERALEFMWNLTLMTREKGAEPWEAAPALLGTEPGTAPPLPCFLLPGEGRTAFIVCTRPGDVETLACDPRWVLQIQGWNKAWGASFWKRLLNLVMAGFGGRGYVFYFAKNLRLFCNSGRIGWELGLNVIYS